MADFSTDQLDSLNNLQRAGAARQDAYAAGNMEDVAELDAYMAQLDSSHTEKFGSFNSSKIPTGQLPDTFSYQRKAERLAELDGSNLMFIILNAPVLIFVYVFE